jgi:integrase
MAMRKQARRQGTIYQISPGKWRVRLNIGTDGAGKRIRLHQIVEGSATDAKRALTGMLKRKDDGLPVALSRQRLGAWADEWVAQHCKSGERTRSDYRSLYRRYLKTDPYMSARTLASLTPKDVQDWVNTLSRRGLSARTVHMAHGAVRACLNQAMKLGMIARNVATLVDLPANDRREMQALTPEQATKFLSAVAGDPWEAFFVLLVLTGLRPGEALGLQWSDLDWSVPCVRVQRALVQGGRLDWPKTKRGRVVHLLDTVVEALQRHRKAQVTHRLKLGDLYRDQDLVFPCETGGAVQCPQNIVGRHYKPILKRAGLPNLRLYDLRHSAATLLFASGAPTKVVSEVLGHASVNLTQNTYIHVIPGMHQQPSATWAPC